MGILGHFGTENYAWRLGIVQNLCEYCWIFVNISCQTFWAYNVLIVPAHILLRYFNCNLVSSFLTGNKVLALPVKDWFFIFCQILCLRLQLQRVFKIILPGLPSDLNDSRFGSKYFSRGHTWHLHELLKGQRMFQ